MRGDTREMTRQTARPIERMNLQDSFRTARELVRILNDGMLTVDLPYQRGAVWTLDQRIALVKSWLSGTPIPSIIVNDRLTSRWQEVSGKTPGTSEPTYAVIDGKQRLLTACAWYSGEFAVPASWFPAGDITGSTETPDGPYVWYAGLTVPAQRDFAFKALLPLAEAKVGSVQEEAEIYLRVNGGGTPQSGTDLARAAQIANHRGG